MPYRILTIDGGGIRGLYASLLIARLEAQIPNLIAHTDLLAGTSTGGIIALSLADGLPISDLVDLYSTHGLQVFQDTWLHTVRALGGLIAAKYDPTQLARILTANFGSARLGDLSKRVVIPTFCLDNQGAKNKPRSWKPKFFHNYPGPDSDAAESVVDVALRTSAAPTYFPVHQGYVDGGLVANNPSMAALAQAIDEGTGKQGLADIRLLSIGTGFSPEYIAGASLNWGLVQWARPLVSALMDGMEGVADYECSRILKGSYCRLSPTLPAPVAMDDASQIGALEKYAADVDLAPVISWLNRVAW